MDDLSAGLPELTQLDKTVSDAKTGFFPEFTPGCRQWIFPTFDQALGDGPGPGIPPGPERPARMHQKYLECLSAIAEA
jgi:hypothetical protein